MVPHTAVLSYTGHMVLAHITLLHAHWLQCVVPTRRICHQITLVMAKLSLAGYHGILDNLLITA